MKAIMLSQNRYELREIPMPQAKANEVLVKVAYAGINRADLYQQQGNYPLPEGGIPGMEISGEIIACGSEVKNYTKGDTICALVSEGAFAEYVSVPASVTLPVPANMGMDEAAALPEGCFTVWISLVWHAHLQKGESVLIHGGAGGIGSLAIQLAKHAGARVFATAGTDKKCDVCRELGAHAINYTREDFVEVIKQATAGKGVDVILDSVGGDYVTRNLASLAHNGRLCIIAFIKGARVEANLSPILLKHLRVMGSTLRTRPLTEKASLAAELRQKLWPKIGVKGGIKPLIAKVFPLTEAEKALFFMHEGLNVGKILLKI